MPITVPMRRRPHRAVVGLAIAAGLLSVGQATPIPARAATRPMLSPSATTAAVVRAFNTADCARIYALTAPWKRPQPQDAGIAACQQGFADGFQNGVTLLRMSVDGRGRYLVPDARAYRQPVVLRRVLDGRTDVTPETLQLVAWHERWYVLALW